MKVLITSGGTKIAIDRVRSITNMSSGTLGSKLAKDALISDNEVIFFCAENSKTPMSANINYQKMNPESCGKAMNDASAMWNQYGFRYTEITYRTFEDYQEKLEGIIKLYKPDLVILAAAVSDYAPENIVNGKIRTKGDLNIPLKPLPKVISEVRNWAGDKAFIVGFKLLVGSTDQELLDSAKESLEKNKLDLICANDLTTLQAGSHKILVVNKHGTFDTTPESLWKNIDKAVRG